MEAEEGNYKQADEDNRHDNHNEQDDQEDRVCDYCIRPFLQ